MNIEWLKGRACTRVEPLAEHGSVFQFRDASLVVESLWRISIGGTLRLTSRDDGQRFGLPAPIDAHAAALSLLRGRRVSDVHLDQRRGDLTVGLDDNVVLEVITDSSGYESWSLSAPGKSIVAASGGTVYDRSPEV